MKCKVQGFYKPAGTSYAIWEITDKDGTYASGAFSEEEFIAGYRSLFPKGKILSIRKLTPEDQGDGWMKVNSGVD